MSLAIQTYSLNQIQVDIDLLNSPSLSEASQALIEKHFHISPPALKDKEPLRNQIQVLLDAKNQLIAAKIYRSQDIFIACLKTAALASVLAVSILLGPGGWMAGGILLYFALDIALYFSETSDLPETLPPIPGFGLLMPLYMALTRVSKLDKSVEKESKALKALLKKYYNENQYSSLRRVYNFYTQLTGPFIDSLDKKTRESKNRLKVIESFPSRDRSPKIEKELSESIRALQTAQKELFLCWLLYQKFNPKGFDAQVNALSTQ